MLVLGRDLVDPFTEFWETVSHELPVDSDAVERGLSSVYGDQGIESFRNVTPYSDTGLAMPALDVASGRRPSPTMWPMS